MAEVIEGFRRVLLLADTTDKKFYLVPHLLSLDFNTSASETEVVTGSTFGRKMKLAGIKEYELSFSQAVTGVTGKKFNTDDLKAAERNRTAMRGLIVYLSDTALAKAINTQLQVTSAAATDIMDMTLHKIDEVYFQIKDKAEGTSDYAGASVQSIEFTCSVQSVNEGLTAVPVIA